MFNKTKAFSGFSVDDIPAAQEFYGGTLGLRVSEEYGMLTLHIAGDRDILVYPKGESHLPATYTILNFSVADIEAQSTNSSSEVWSWRSMRMWTKKGLPGAKARQSPGSKIPLATSSLSCNWTDQPPPAAPGKPSFSLH